MSKYILTVTLNPVLDYTARLARVSLGEDFYLPEFTASAGGKGINITRALKNLGIKSRAVGFLGGATGNLMQRILDKESIHHDFIKIPQETRKSMTVIDSRSRVTRVIEDGPRTPAASQKLFLRKFKSLLGDCRWVVISGRLLTGMSDSFYGDLIAAARARGVKTILDTSGKPLAAGLKSSPFLLKPNLEEAEFFLKKKLNSFSQLKKATQCFLKFGVKIVLISLAQKGAVAADRKDCWFAQAPKVKVQNTVGCGDAMLGGFLYWYSQNQDLGQCLKTAVAAGSANCLSSRPGGIARLDVLILRKQVELRRVR